MILAPGTTSFSPDVQIVDDAGLPVTGLVAATFPALSWSLGGNTAATAISLSDLAAITTTYTSGGVKERSSGVYRLDLPNGALTTAGEVTIYGETTGKRMIPIKITVAYVPANTVQWLGGTIPAVSVTGVPKVDVQYFKGTTSAGAAGYAGIDWAQMNAPSATQDLAGTTLGDIRMGFLDASVASRMAAVDYAAPDNAGIAAIEAKTTNLPSDPASASGPVGSVTGNVGGLSAQAKTDAAAAITSTGGPIQVDGVGRVTPRPQPASPQR